VRRRKFVSVLGCAAVWPLVGNAQQVEKPKKIGILAQESEATFTKAWRSFVEGLRDHGWIEGKNIEFERRFANGVRERLAELAAELVRLNVDVILTVGSVPPIYAKQATSSIPIIFTASGDPVATGLVASLAKPGGNVTGVATQVSTELGTKRLQLLKEAIPGLARVSVLWEANESNVRMFKSIEVAAASLAIKLYSVQMLKPADVDTALEALAQQLPDGLLIFGTPLTFFHGQQIVNFAANNRLPAMYSSRDFVDVGGLMSYGPGFSYLLRRAAEYVDKMLKGVRPNELPVEQPIKFYLVINLKAARAQGIAIAQSVLAQADELIE